MAKKKEKLEHIQVKDNGIKLSQKIGDTLSASTLIIQKQIIDSLLKGKDETSLIRYKIKQNNQMRDFSFKTKNIITQTKKDVKKALQSDTTVNLTDKQVLRMSSQIDKGLLFLQQNAMAKYQSTVKSVVLRCQSAADLQEQLKKHIESGVDVGVIYKDGKHYKFDNYWEMKARTDIQQDIGSNMVDTGSKLGVIFYIAAYFGDCAKDHADYQGKIYVDKNWKDNAPKDRIDEIQSYIDSKNIKTVQEVMEEPVWFTTRPNCRHYFQYIDIDSVLGAKNKEDVKKLRDERNLNFNGQYKPEKYKALQQQRLNERTIRAKKEEIQKQEQLLALNPGDKVIQSKILSGEALVRKYQAKQRELIKQYDNLERDYKRENLGVRAGFDVKKQSNNDVNSNEQITVVFNPKASVTFTKGEIKSFKETGRYEKISKAYDVLNPIKKDFALPQELKNKGYNGEIIDRKPTMYREGTLEHIFSSHQKEIKQDPLFAEKIKATITGSDEIQSGKNDSRFELNKFIETKTNKTGKIYDYWFKVVIEKEKIGDYFTVVTAHPFKLKHKNKE